MLKYSPQDILSVQQMCSCTVDTTSLMASRAMSAAHPTCPLLHPILVLRAHWDREFLSVLPSCTASPFQIVPLVRFFFVVCFVNPYQRLFFFIDF